MHQTFKATAQVTGHMNEGNGCAPTEPPVPTPPTEQPCEQVLVGRTLRPLDAADITRRDKSGDGGEVNADGWGKYTFRLYGASDNALDSVTYTATAAQGFTFKSSSAGAVTTGDEDPTTDNGALGMLDNNGYDGTSTGIGTPIISADGKTVTLTIAHMPAKGVFAFSVAALPDGSGQQMVIDHVLSGRLTGCATPADQVVMSTQNSPVDCATKTVTVTTTTTTTKYAWDAETGTWILDDTSTVVNQQTSKRAATPEEAKACASPVKYEKRSYQVDRYIWKCKSLSTKGTRFDNDGYLSWGEDRAFYPSKCGTSKWEFVTVQVPVTATKAQERAILNRATKVGDITTSAKGYTATKKGSIIYAWRLGKGASTYPSKAWGPNHNVKQQFVGRSGVRSL